MAALTLNQMLALFYADGPIVKKDAAVEALNYPLRVNWETLLAGDTDAEWLVEDVWPMGRQVHLHAARKSGKSLVSLWMAANLAMGRDPFTQMKIKPVRVGYFDLEMTEADLRERVVEMGFDHTQLDENLYYYLGTSLIDLDTAMGGMELMRIVARDAIEAVIIDTMSRVVAGGENDNDTYRHFYQYTGMPLKAKGIPLFRLDHEGHEAGRSRGASAKADDVDLVWQLRKVDGGLEFVRKAARISWVPETVTVLMRDEPLSFSKGLGSWPAGTGEKAEELDKLGAPNDITRRQAIELLKEHNLVAGKTIVLSAALRFRKMRGIIGSL